MSCRRLICFGFAFKQGSSRWGDLSPSEDLCIMAERRKRGTSQLTSSVFLHALQVAKERKVEEHPARTGSEVAEDGEVEERIVSYPCQMCRHRPKTLANFRVGVAISCPIRTENTVYLTRYLVRIHLCSIGLCSKPKSRSPLSFVDAGLGSFCLSPT